MNRASSYEGKIIAILNKENIPFVREKSFRDLRKGLFRYDFYLPQREVLIEVHGEQHYFPNNRFHKSPAQFKAAQERDRKKISYALAHNIPLYAIPFWEIRNIGCADDIFQEEFHVTHKFFNDDRWRKYQKNR